MMKKPIWVKEKLIAHGENEWSVEKTEGSYPVFIVDTEGLGAMDEDSNHDTKIFLLAILLSSLLLYNS